MHVVVVEMGIHSVAYRVQVLMRNPHVLLIIIIYTELLAGNSYGGNFHIFRIVNMY